MATYTEMITRVRNYLDRDATIITDSQIVNFLNYAADKAYRTLRVPAHEVVMEFTVADGDFVTDKSSSFGSEVNMPVPNDLIELIYIQKKGTGIVWNQKVDGRTFHDRFADKKDSNYYTRIGGNFLIHGTLSTGDILEVSYYQRGNAVDATYSVTPANYLAQATKGITTMTRQGSSSSATTTLYFAAGTTTAQIDALAPTNATLTQNQNIGGVVFSVAAYMLPAYQPNWLRDENERIILYGALAEAFAYLNEPEQIQIYDMKYKQEIEELNAEERKRVSTGGNTSISFSGMGLI